MVAKGSALILVPGILLAGIGAVSEQTADSANQEAVHLLQRATYSARHADVATVLEIGKEAWLDRQLSPETMDDERVKQALTRLPDRALTPAELAERYTMDAGTRRRLADTTSIDAAERRQLREEMSQTAPARILGTLVSERIIRAAWSDRQLQEVMTEFWYDHFNVFWGKGPDRYLVGDYERTVIRPNVFGRFEDLLAATARHPAMLIYLDNTRSVAPQIRNQSRRKVAERSGRLPGLNENYARELLELHTLGVDGGYTQDDVIAVAKAFTGWGVVPPPNRNRTRRPVPGEPLTFVFRPELHDPSDKTVMGTPIRGGGLEEGEAVLRLLARHPSTANHVSRQLAVAFVADDPPQGLIEDVAQVFLDTEGDLAAVTRALFTHDLFYEESHKRSRIKSPFRLVVSALRATEGRFVRPQGALATLRQLGQMPYLASAPTGYPQGSAAWAGSGALLGRSSFVMDLAAGRIAGLRVDASAVNARALVAYPDELDSVALSRLLIPGVDATGLGGRVAAGVQAAAGTADGWNERTAAEMALGLVLASPEFQRH